MFTRQGTVFSSHFWESETLSGHEAGSVLGGLRELSATHGYYGCSFLFPPQLKLSKPSCISRL